MMQHLIQIPKMKALKGDIKQVHYQPISQKGWFSGEYAKHTDEYLTHNFGFRPNLVRLDNQLAYSMFRETRAKNVVIGKEQYLYETNYIDAYTGRDFVGDSLLSERVGRMKLIQDSMNAMGKHLLVVLAAGKASFYPEYIPDELMHTTDTTNYHYYKRKLKEAGVQHIDFNEWFIQHKGKMPYPLYPKTGIHWSEYGMLIAADSIISRVEEFNPEWDLGELYWNEVDYVDERRQVDDDIELALNLIERFPNFKMAYPKVQYNLEEKDSISVIMISDSFFWRMFSNKVMPNVFTDGQFWYYNYATYPKHFKEKTTVQQLNLFEEIENVDVIIMMATEGNLKMFPWGSDEMLAEFFRGNYTFDANAERERKIREWSDKILADENWLKVVQQQANEMNMSLDTMIRRNAIYMIDVQSKK